MPASYQPRQHPKSHADILHATPTSYETCRHPMSHAGTPSYALTTPCQDLPRHDNKSHAITMPLHAIPSFTVRQAKPLHVLRRQVTARHKLHTKLWRRTARQATPRTTRHTKLCHNHATTQSRYAKPHYAAPSHSHATARYAKP